VLVVAEGGGKVTDLEGRPYRPGDGSILATNGRIHAEMQSVARGVSGNRSLSWSAQHVD
jgi:myo-inositol-1(or 4)-monophosphatase